MMELSEETARDLLRQMELLDTHIKHNSVLMARVLARLNNKNLVGE